MVGKKIGISPIDLPVIVTPDSPIDLCVIVIPHLFSITYIDIGELYINIVITHIKLQPMECYHIFSISRVVYLAKNHYESYSPQMVPVTPNLGVWLMDYVLLYTELPDRSGTR